MPDKEGSDEKSTKSVVSKKQKQMMGEEGYDIARDMGRVRPSKDKKDATTMPVSDEVKKTQKVNKGPSALERVKKKYKGQIMNVDKKKANEELDLTQVAEAFGGYIVEANGDKKQKPTQKDLSAEADKRKKEQRQQQQRANSPLQPGMDDEEGQGVGFSPQQQASVTRILDRIGANPKQTAQQVKKDAPKPKKSTATRADYPKTRAELEAKRKDYQIDPKTNQPSDAGVEKFARRSLNRKQIASGSNVPIELSQSDLDTARKKMVGTGEKGTDVGKYGGRLARRRGKNMPSLDQVKADIDKRNPTYPSPIKTMGKDGEMKNRPLPFSTRQFSYKSPVDDFIERIRRAKKEDPEGLRKGLQDMPDDPRMSQFKKENPSTTARFIAKPQSVVGATGGLIAKTLNPALAGTEAMQRYREGRKGDAAISAVQALGGPIGFGAGVVNYIKSKRAAAAAAQAEPQSAPATSGGKSKESRPKTEKGGGDGKKPPKTPTQTPADDGGGKAPEQEGKPIDSTVQKGIDYQIAKDARDLAKDTLGKVFNPKNFQARKRTKTGRRSAGS